MMDNCWLPATAKELACAVGDQCRPLAVAWTRCTAHTRTRQATRATVLRWLEEPQRCRDSGGSAFERLPHRASGNSPHLNGAPSTGALPFTPRQHAFQSMGGYQSTLGPVVWLAYGRQAFGKHGFDAACRRFIPGDVESELAGKHYIVTGANSGLGFEASKALLSRGASVAMVCRSEERGKAALAKLAEATGKPESFLSLHIVDMEDKDSVRGRARAAMPPSAWPRHTPRLGPWRAFHHGKRWLWPSPRVPRPATQWEPTNVHVCTRCLSERAAGSVLC